MNKKPYQAPVVIKIKLQVKDAVLASCRLSGDPSDKDTATLCITPVIGCIT